MENDILHIRPLQNVFRPLAFIDDFCIREQINISFAKLHLIKKFPQYFIDSDSYHLHKIRSKRHDEGTRNKSGLPLETEEKQKNFTIELAVFVDAEAYNHFRPYMNMTQMRNMMLEYVSYIQTFFHHPSLGVRIDISLVRLDIMDTQPSDLQIDTDSAIVLSTFCQYAKTHNPPDDNDPGHWDIGLYVTGTDLFEFRIVTKHGIFKIEKNLEKVPVMGKSFSNTVCSTYPCAVVKFLPYQIETKGLRSALNAVYYIGQV